jgi:histidinol dehydrogenase
MIPVSRVGLYVPGGRRRWHERDRERRPAKVAGVGAASPPQISTAACHLTRACHILDVDGVCGGRGRHNVCFVFPASPSGRLDLGREASMWQRSAAQGPRQHLEAGPTEIAVLADATAEPAHADLILKPAGPARGGGVDH